MGDDKQIQKNEQNKSIEIKTDKQQEKNAFDPGKVKEAGRFSLPDQKELKKKAGKAKKPVIKEKERVVPAQEIAVLPVQEKLCHFPGMNWKGVRRSTMLQVFMNMCRYCLRS